MFFVLPRCSPQDVCPHVVMSTPTKIRTYEGEFGMIPQLLGNDEAFISKSIERLDPLKPWGLDINMGCPVKHTL